jgi:hypothetical protein
MKMIERLQEQKQLVENPNYVQVVKKWATVNGQRQLVEKEPAFTRGGGLQQTARWCFSFVLAANPSSLTRASRVSPLHPLRSFRCRCSRKWSFGTRASQAHHRRELTLLRPCRKRRRLIRSSDWRDVSDGVSLIRGFAEL